MARYGIDYYSSKDFPLSYYGTDNPIKFDASPFTALPSGHGAVTLKWNSPFGAWAKLRIVRNTYGYSVNAWDGEIVFTTTRGVDPTLFTDVVANNKPGFYYYSIWVYETTQYTWVKAGDVTGLVVKDYGSIGNFYSYIPSIFKISQPYSASSDWDNEDLKQFLALFGYQVDKIRSLTELIKNRYDFQTLSGSIIPEMLNQFGIKYEPEIGYQRSRTLVRDSILISKAKGSYTGLAEYVKALTGYGIPEPDKFNAPNPSIDGITIGHNLMLDYNDSSFEEGVGKWESKDSSANVNAAVAKEIKRVSITSNIARLVIGSHNFLKGDKVTIDGFDMPLFNTLSNAVTLTSVDSTSVYFSLTAVDLGLRDAYNLLAVAYPVVHPYPTPWSEPTAPTLFPNKQKGILRLSNKSTSSAALTASCGETYPITRGVPVDPGLPYTFSIYSGANTTARSVVAGIKWYDRFGAIISTVAGTPIINTVGVFGVRPYVTQIAPSVITLAAFTSTQGTGYTNGTYTNVPLVFVSGKQPTIVPKATVTVSGNKVTNVSINPIDGGAGSDTTTIFTVNASAVGGTGSGFSVRVASVNDAYYAVPYVIVSNVAGSASNEYHYFDAAQFEQSDVPTSFDEARQIHLTLKATRINELHNPHFYNGVTAPWSLTNASTGVDLEATDPTQDNYDIYSKTIQSNKATIKLTTVHDFKAGDYVVITHVDSTFNGKHLLTDVDDTQLFFDLTAPDVTTTLVTGGYANHLGDSLVITSTSSATVVLCSKTTNADLMPIYYPLTPYTFSIYMYTDQGTDSVCPIIKWYDTSYNLISTSEGSQQTLSQDWTRVYVTGTAPSNAAYAEACVEWEPGAAGNSIDAEAALFENASFPEIFFNGWEGPANGNELIWENNQPNNARSHYYKNFFALRTRLNQGLLDDYIGLGTTIAVYFAQPGT